MKLLADKIDKEVPNGAWGSSIILLSSLGRDRWTELPSVMRMRLEKLILEDLLRGHKDIYRPGSELGKLGSWAAVFGSKFENKEEIATRLEKLLNEGWYGQNYVAEYFFSRIEGLNFSDAQRDRLIAAIKYAIANDAKTVKEKVSTLPASWIVAINAGVT